LKFALREEKWEDPGKKTLEARERTNKKLKPHEITLHPGVKLTDPGITAVIDQCNTT